MNDTHALLDEALRLGDMELQLLAAGEVDGAGETAQLRGRLLEQALEHCAADQACRHDLLTLRDKLGQLMALHGRVTDEARRLHADMRDELQRTRQENDRHNGYGKTARAMGGASLLHKQG